MIFNTSPKPSKLLLAFFLFSLLIFHAQLFFNSTTNSLSSRSSEAKLSNFTRLEPTLRLLEIPFTFNMVCPWHTCGPAWSYLWAPFSLGSRHHDRAAWHSHSPALSAFCGSEPQKGGYHTVFYAWVESASFVLQQQQLTGQSMECMRGSGKLKLDQVETGIFREVNSLCPKQYMHAVKWY